MEDQIMQEPSDDVNIEQEGVQPEGDAQIVSDVIAEQPEKEPDDYWKNKAYEFERKYSNTSSELKEIKELIQNQQQRAPETSQYSEDQLRAALSSSELTPEQRSFAQSELDKISSRKSEERDKRLLDQWEERQKNQLLKQQAEQAVISDPRFQSALVKLPNGSVQWKQDSPLAQAIGAYMQDPRVSGQPDGMLIAAKLAYADMEANRSVKELQATKRQNEQLKSQTMIEGGGKQYNKPKVNAYQESMQNLRRGIKGAGKSAVKEYLRSQGRFK